MPIYEFYCPGCHRLYSFLSRRIDTRSVPPCPQCGRADMAREASLFAISRGRTEGEGAGEGAAGPDESRLESAMAQLAGEAEGLDDDPRRAARFMRKLMGTAGIPESASLEEALRRMESGEDPESIEQDLGDALTGAGEDEAGGATRRTLQGLRRRLVRPTVDPTLYEM